MKLLPVAAILALSVSFTACDSMEEAPEPAFETAHVPRAGDPPLATPAPKRASGVYNSSTGQIEWHSYDGPQMPTPAPRKRWWLF